MKLVNVQVDGETTIGLKTDKGVLDVKAAAAKQGLSVPETMKALIEQNDLSDLKQLAETATGPFLSEEDFTYAPVIPDPDT
ncbi:hypothetical protein [Atopococcus tabaci]|uniref:hypothetical protein n=1 Tax=Atopococcus tabaci TaxID=269774 RepID=UPI002409A2C2|nr:hypothetical protein [Atopococcus tabaci]